MFKVLSQTNIHLNDGSVKYIELIKEGWDEFAGILKLKVYWPSIVFIGLLISFTGSFDTDSIASLETRTVFVVSFLLGSGIGCALLAGIYRAFTGISSLRRFDIVVKISVLWVLVATIPARIMISYLSNEPLTAMQFFRSAIHASSITFLVIIIMYIFGQRRYVAKRKQARAEAAAGRNEKQITPEPTPAFEGRLPYYIESEDHYLKMVYLGNVEFIRANLNEVAAGFSSRGMRCHKSYWVSLSAIEKRRRQGRQLLLVLKDGTEIPVGRSFEKKVRASLDAGMALC